MPHFKSFCAIRRRDALEAMDQKSDLGLRPDEGGRHQRSPHELKHSVFYMRGIRLGHYFPHYFPHGSLAELDWEWMRFTQKKCFLAGLIHEQFTPIQELARRSPHHKPVSFDLQVLKSTGV